MNKVTEDERWELVRDQRHLLAILQAFTYLHPVSQRWVLRALYRIFNLDRRGVGRGGGG